MTGTLIEEADLNRLTYLMITVGKKQELILFRHYLYKKYKIDCKTHTIDMKTGRIRKRNDSQRNFKMITLKNRKIK